MTDEQKAELAALADAKTDAEDALRGYGFRNVFGLTFDELRAVGRRAAELEAAVTIATARLDGFHSRLRYEWLAKVASEATDPVSVALRSVKLTAADTSTPN